MEGASFPYRTKVEEVRVGPVVLQLEQLFSLDETIDEFFAAYDRSGDVELFGKLAPYFGQLWPAGKALAAYALNRAEEWRGASILELGCGLALPSLVLARCGLGPIRATDLHPDVPVFLRSNCRRNGLTVQYDYLDWQDAGEGAQVILGSDLVYDRTQPNEILGFLKRVSWNEAIFADPGRPYWDAFLGQAKKAFQVEEFLKDSIFFAKLTP